MKKDKKNIKCCIEGCKRMCTNFKHFMCNAHYVRYQRTGSPGSPKIRKKNHLPLYKP